MKYKITRLRVFTIPFRLPHQKLQASNRLRDWSLESMFAPAFEFSVSRPNSPAPNPLKGRTAVEVLTSRAISVSSSIRKLW